MSSIVLTAAMIAEATAGRLLTTGGDEAFDGVSIDTRTMRPGALFVALRGERFDGHAFVQEAVRRGAAGLLVSEAPRELPAATVILVEDTLDALQALGRAVRRASGATVIAITGNPFLACTFASSTVAGV